VPWGKRKYARKVLKKKKKIHTTIKQNKNKSDKGAKNAYKGSSEIQATRMKGDDEISTLLQEEAVDTRRDRKKDETVSDDGISKREGVLSLFPSDERPYHLCVGGVGTEITSENIRRQ